MDDMKQIEVAAAVIIENKRVFAAQRSNSSTNAGLWEFPGGKLEAGEDGPQAVVREIEEEFGARIEAETLLLTVEHQYPNFFLTMHAYLCRRVAGEFALKQHEASRWLSREQLRSVCWSEADLPIVVAVQDLLE